jgi:hypothetical protein
MDSAPIDIKYQELLTWLESRYLIPKDWARKLELIQTKKNELLDTFFSRDSAEMKKLQDTFKIFRGSYDTMLYNDITRFFTMLTKTEEAKSKTLFGNYNSSFIHDAYLLTGIYNKNNMHLSESSKVIVQYIGYEIPNLEKNTQYLNSTVNDYNSKISERNFQIEKNTNKIKEYFKKYNIPAQNEFNVNSLALSLIQRLSSLGSNLKNLESFICGKKVEEAIKIYDSFYQIVYGQNLDKSVLKTLREYVGVGGTKDNSNSYDKIIKSKIEEYNQKYENIDMQADLEAQIWNFKLVTSSESGNIIKNENLPILLNSNSRNKLKNDLTELLIFMNFRLLQSNNKDEINLQIFQTNLRELSMKITPDILTEAKSHLESIIQSLDHPDLTFLLNIYDDEKNLKTILNNFELVKSQIKKFQLGNKESQAKIEDLEKEVGENSKKITQYKKDAKQIKKVMEKFLTDTLKRKITIIGDINLIS